MGEENSDVVRTTEKSLRLLEALHQTNGASSSELAAKLDMNQSTVHTHLATLRQHGFVSKLDTEYFLGPSVGELSGYITGLRIVETLKHQPASISELSDKLDMNEGVVRSNLSSLVDNGYVIQHDESYRVSLRFLDIGGAVRDSLELYRAAEPKVADLAAKTGELVNLTTEENAHGVYLYQGKGDEALELDTHVGKHIYLHNNASGKAILSALPHDRVDEIIEERGLPQFTPKTITERQTLFDELDTIRERGVAFDDEERLDGLRCVGAPIRTEDDDVLGAISVSAPKSRMAEDTYKNVMPDKVLSTVNLIELEVNYSS